MCALNLNDVLSGFQPMKSRALVVRIYGFEKVFSLSQVGNGTDGERCAVFIRGASRFDFAKRNGIEQQANEQE
ncbi:MAG: hypothetical protein KAY91_03045 [Rhodocyclaceae bacterium]|jgi:hypothetical protein|uniref:Uncharacterized protein n=1 Tax=Fluviibacter phosphoraccumulans TaxID=1751046 RepID=A0A7R6QV44_9RHOO|nr:hypothetical protein [Rhodocyclaceae bacterium]BBU67862.1 hypothetical protein ICHIAU1_01450 [Fluviibacter phosphoraccumulans]